MKKLLIILGIVAFAGTSALAYSSITSSTNLEIVEKPGDDEKKKKKCKKKKCSKEEACCKKDAAAKKSCCKKGEAKVETKTAE